MKVSHAEKLETMRTMMLERGLVADRWGNYKHPQRPNHRIKIQRNVIRLEGKRLDRWVRITSANWRSMPHGQLASFIQSCYLVR